tara:strand:- start:4601 stop:5452 length:852 start_codon:yes stop_codon:yes gene_type:complete
MQSESVLILVFIFIILIAVVVIGILYSMHVSKYDESHTFYKNLLEIIKNNPNLEVDLQDKLLEKDFDISDLSTSQIELSNIFGAKIYSDDQIDRVNTTNTSYTEGRITTFTSNMLKDNERKYYQKAYNLIHDNNNLDLSNLYGIDFNNTGEVYNVLSNLSKVYDINNINDNVMSYSNMNVAMNKLQDNNDKYYRYNSDITLNSNLATSNSITINNNLKICNTDASAVCFELYVNENGFLMGKSSLLAETDQPFVFGDNNTNCNLWLADTKAGVPSYTNYVIST